MVISTLRIVPAPKYRAEVIRTLAAQLGQVRVQPGCLRCDLYRDVADPGAITLVEEWGSQAELDLRLRSEDYRAVLAAIELAQEPPVIHFDTVSRRAGLEIVASARGAGAHGAGEGWGERMGGEPGRKGTGLRAGGPRVRSPGEASVPAGPLDAEGRDPTPPRGGVLP